MRWAFTMLAALPALVNSLASTDSYRDADIPQSGYLPNHNMQPNVVGSSSFSNLWEWQSPIDKEYWLAKPLVYTPDGGSEVLITSSEMNYIRVFDAKTGSLLQERQLQAPFTAADSNCGDVPDWIGVTGTPIIDPATDIMYVMSKGYKDGTTSGTINGIYKMYALRIPTLEDVDGFPTLIDGNNADNDPARYFVGGVALQRPSLTEINGHIVAGFGSHCGRWNYTGYMVSVSKDPSVGVTSIWATEYPPGAPSPQPLDISVEMGGKAGIWQSGMGLATVGNAVYFVSGNGQGMHNGNVPASGRLPMSTLSHSTVRMELSADGKWSQIDYFQPYDYTSLNAGDRDVGSSGFTLLDPDVFNGAGVDRIGVVAGKRGRAYVLNANDLGGFRNGADTFDGTLQTIELGGAVYGGFGSYPHEGGYIYVTTVGGPLSAFRIGHDSAGKPVFSLVGQSEWTSAGRVGVGQMTITSDNGRPGTGIVWISDVTVGLKAYRAIPEDGVMVEIPLPGSMRGANKFQRPVFGDGRVYYQADNDRLYCLGSPVDQAVTCEDVDFGSVQLGTQSTASVSCTAEATISALEGCSVADPSFICDNSTLPSGSISAGSTFAFDVTWDLENEAQGVVPGFVSSSLSLALSAPAEYGQNAVVALEGTAMSSGPYLHATSSQVPFGNIVLFSDAIGYLDASAVLQNVGNGTLTITGIAYQSSADGAYSNITDSGYLGAGFVSTEFPTEGSTMAEDERVSVAVRFSGEEVGDYESFVTIWSDGGSVTINLNAGVRSPPVARFEVSDGEGGWDALDPLFRYSFGDVLAGTSENTQIRICNDGGSPMTITISKPPVDAQLHATNPGHDLPEGLQVLVDECALGTVAVRAGPLQPNHPSQDLRAMWTLTTDGLNATTGEDSGLHDVVFDARVVARQLGPLLPDGTSRYQYVGCFSDTRFGRNLQTQVNNATMQQTNTIQQCQGLCEERGFIFAGLQYHQECWCGGPPNNIRYPDSWTDPKENRCTFDCTGDDTQACGGDGGYVSIYADATAFDIEAFLEAVRNGAEPPPPEDPTTTSITDGPSPTSATDDPEETESPPSNTTIPVPPPAGTFEPSPLNPQQPALINGEWEYAGCFEDLVDGARTLDDAFTASDEMTLERCGAFCDNNGSPYNYFGLTYGRECFCGWSMDEDALRASESDCTNPCMGSTTGICGGWRRISTYRHVDENAPPTGPQHVQQAGDYQWVGCQTEADGGRALGDKSYASDDMTVDTCAAFCEENQYQHMGVEYGRECYCGNTPGEGSVPTEASDCNMPCKGDSQQLCGAGSRLDFYILVPGSGSTTSSAAPEPTGISSSSAVSSAMPSLSEESSAAESSEVISSSELSSSDIPSSSSSSSSSFSSEEELITSSEASSSIVTSSAVPSSSDVLDDPSSEVSSMISSIESSSTLPVEEPESSSTESSSALDEEPELSTSSDIVSSSLEESSSPLPEITSSSSSIEEEISSSLPPSIPSVSASTSSLEVSSEIISSTPSSSSSPTATPTNGYYHVGCYQDVDDGHALPHLLSNRSVTPELCLQVAHDRASNAPTPTAAPAYVFVEYHHECYAGNTFDFQGSAVTSLVGTRACIDYCYGSVLTQTTSGTTTVTTLTDNFCGGPKMFNLYATEVPVDFPTTGGPVTTRTTGTPRA